MRRAPHSQPPLDPKWLDQLTQRCNDLRGGGARFEDLYIEQRLELKAAVTGDQIELEECRLEGAAARWRSASRMVLHARTGLSASAIGELLAQHADRVAMPPVRPTTMAEMTPPRVWLDWARQVGSRLAPNPSVVRFLNRRSAVVRRDGWVAISSPAHVRIERSGEAPSALLAVWGHPSVGDWIHELAEEAPKKTWQPNPGTVLPVLFSAGTAGVLVHELVGHMAESDLISTNASPLKDLVGAIVSTGTLNITDDPTRTDLAGAFDYDDEGVRAKPIQLIRAGKFERFLCDREGGRHLATDAGRGRRATWSRPPVARLSNLVIAAGETKAEDMEADLDQGIVVTRIGGATVDPISSRLVLRIERGWEIRHGRRRRPLAPCELTGSVMEVLTNVDPRIGSDPTPDWRLGWCLKDGYPLATGSEAPSLLVRRLEIL